MKFMSLLNSQLLFIFIHQLSCKHCHKKTTPLSLVAMAPFPNPDPQLSPGWVGGPAVIPGTLLAVEHINSKCDILQDYKLELIVEDSGCDVDTKASISTVRSLFYKNSNVVGIVGPGCSEATIAVGKILNHPMISLLNIAPSATSPELVNHTVFTNTFRPIGSSLEFIRIYLDFMSVQNFTNVAVMFEADRPFHRSAAQTFIDELLEMEKLVGIDMNVAPFPMASTFIPLESLKNTYPVIFVFGGSGLTRKLMCLAYHKNFLYPEYQFIFSERRINHFVQNVTVEDGSQKLECSPSTMEEAIHGVILNLIQLSRTDRNSTLVSGINYDEFEQQYLAELDAFLLERNNSFDKVVDTEHESGFYDSTWALALSFNASIPRLKDELNMSLSEYKLGCQKCTKIIRDELLGIEFEGARGRVRFSNVTLDAAEVTIIDMFFVDEASLKQVARYDPSLPDGQRLVIVDDSMFIGDKFLLNVISPPLFIDGIVFAGLAITAAIIVFLHILNTKWTNVKSVKATSPLLNHITFSGCYLYLLSVVFLSLQSRPEAQHPVVFGVRCSGFIWCESIALTLIFSTLCVKTWRVFRIFSHASASVLTNLEDHRLVVYICALLLVDVVFNLAWNLINPWFRYLVAQNELNTRWICNCRNNATWLSSLLVQKAVLGFALLYLSIRTRRIPKMEYKQTKSTNILIYCLILLYSFTIPVYLFLMTSTSVVLVTVSYLALFIKNIVSIGLCAVILFLPPVLPILRDKSQTLLAKFRSKSISPS